MSEKIITGIPVELQNSPAQSVEVEVEHIENNEMFRVPNFIGKVATSAAEIIIPGTPVEGANEREKVVLDTPPAKDWAEIPGTDQYIKRQSELADIARSENAIGNTNKMES